MSFSIKTESLELELLLENSANVQTYFGFQFLPATPMYLGRNVIPLFTTASSLRPPTNKRNDVNVYMEILSFCVMVFFFFSFLVRSKTTPVKVRIEFFVVFGSVLNLLWVRMEVSHQLRIFFWNSIEYYIQPNPDLGVYFEWSKVNSFYKFIFW